MRTRSLILISIFILVIVAVVFLKNNDRIEYVQHRVDYVHADDFGANGNDSKDDAKQIQAAIDYAQKSKIGKVRLTGNQKYIIQSSLTIKEEVELQFDQNTRLVVIGNFPALTLEKNASMTNGIIEVTEPSFDSEVITLDGKHQFWSFERTVIDNVTLMNTSGRRQGTGLFLHANEPNHFISFVDFSRMTIVGFYRGIHIQAQATKENDTYNWINGNRFIQMTIDDCIRCIEIDSSASIPNEATGNDFKSVQIQVTPQTEKVLFISGSHNTFEGMIWDTHLVSNPHELIEFTPESANNHLFTNVKQDQIVDYGYLNKMQ